MRVAVFASASGHIMKTTDDFNRTIETPRQFTSHSLAVVSGMVSKNARSRLENVDLSHIR